MTIRASIEAAAMAALVAVLVGGCSDPSEGVKSSNASEVVKSLNDLGKRASDEDIERVSETTAHSNPVVAAEAVRSLGSMRRPKAVEALTKVVAEEKRPEVREEAVLELGRQEAEQPTLAKLREIVARDPDSRVRAAAATSIARMRSWDDVALLMDVADKDPDVLVQSRALGAVEQMVGVRFGYDSTANAADRKKAMTRMRSIALTAAARLRQAETRGKGGR